MCLGPSSMLWSGTSDRPIEHFNSSLTVCQCRDTLNQVAVSMKDVAQRAGVSIATVSNALNRPDMLHPATLGRVHEAIDELGFVRNGSAAQLRAGKSKTLGLVVPNIANPFFTDVSRGVEDVASSRGYSVFLCNSDENPAKEDRYLRLLMEQRVDGLLIRPTEDTDKRMFELRDRGFGTVLLNRTTAQPDFCSVSVDGERGMADAVNHLYELGHRHIAWVTWSLKNPAFTQRGRGAAKATKQLGMELTTLTVPGMNNGSGAIAATKVLALADRPTAMVCANDLLALDAMRGLIEHGLRVPQDISVMGFDDIEFCANARVPLSSVNIARYQLGATAATLVIEECESPETHSHQKIVFQPKLVVRESTGPALR
jgi:LacI family transcriptional regulator